MTEGEAANPRIYVPFEMKAGERRLFTTIIALAPHREEIHENLGIVYQHTPLEWMNVTSAFWKSRLGRIESGIRENEELGHKYSDMHIRFILDNFNCLSFNGRGQLLTNWQGAPSHSLSRLWGIDIEPDVVSVMYAVPEVGPCAVEYLLERNRPRFSLYSDHSMFFFISPLLIAGKYLELTGDSAYFQNRMDVLSGLEAVYRGMLAHKHKERALFSSHYASDLIVFKKYDYGANVQCYYALKSWCAIQKAVGKQDEEAQELLMRMPADMAECMEADGTFGRQITGGNNLEENKDRFYIPEELWYYGGEDTATVLAPLYGLYEFDYGPYVNLHRFARSLFITNYDPEYQTLRELHFGMNPSATGCTLRLGGSYTRREMLHALEILFERLDETGSLFWWPRAYNKKRCLTRCSQGQGAWIQQSVEQWYGLRMDGTNRMLTIKPQGLLTSYKLTGMRLGVFCFDITYEEQEAQTVFIVKNCNKVDFTVKFVVRQSGAAAEGKLQRGCILVPAGRTIRKQFYTEAFVPEESGIVQTECAAFAEQGIIFRPYGIVMPKLSAGKCSIFLLRFVIAHMETEEWEKVSVELEVPKGWLAKEKQYYIWDYQPVFTEGKTVCEIGSVKPGTHGVAGFYISLPDTLAGDEKSVMLSAHPFPQTADGSLGDIELYIEGECTECTEPVTAILRVNGVIRGQCVLPVRILDKEEYGRKFDRMYHGV